MVFKVNQKLSKKMLKLLKALNDMVNASNSLKIKYVFPGDDTTTL
jgi:hypothetical protein